MRGGVPRGVGRLEPGAAPDLPSRRAAGLGRRGWRPSCRRRARCRGSVAGAAAGAFSTQAALARRRGGGVGGAGGARDRGRAGGEVPEAEDAPARVAAFWQVAGGSGRAWLDFQNDVTVKDVGPGGAGELPLGRAHEALHHAWNGDRSGQDRRRRRARGAGGADRAKRGGDRDTPPSGRPTCRCRSRRSGPGARARASRRSG